jgi:hypothetical protein
MKPKNNDRHLYLIDTGRSDSLDRVRYEDLMRALGGYIDEHGLTEVLITQIPDGILLKGTVIDRSRAHPVEKITAVLFTNDDVEELLQQSMSRRGAGAGRRSRRPLM